MKFSKLQLTTLCLLGALSASALAQQVTTEMIGPLGGGFRYNIRDLGVVGANPSQPGQPLVISNSGWISGASAVSTAEHAVLWHGGEMIDIGRPGLGGNSFGYGVNESGESAGDAEVVPSDISTTEDFCGWQATGFSFSPTPCVPFVWKQGKMIPLRTLGGVNGVATQINNRGAIAGYAENTSIDPSCPSPQQYQFKPVVWFRGSIHPLPTGSDLEGVALATRARWPAVQVAVPRTVRYGAGIFSPFMRCFGKTTQASTSAAWEGH